MGPTPVRGCRRRWLGADGVVWLWKHETVFLSIVLGMDVLSFHIICIFLSVSYFPCSPSTLFWSVGSSLLYFTFFLIHGTRLRVSNTLADKNKPEIWQRLPLEEQSNCISSLRWDQATSRYASPPIVCHSKKTSFTWKYIRLGVRLWPWSCME